MSLQPKSPALEDSWLLPTEFQIACSVGSVLGDRWQAAVSRIVPVHIEWCSLPRMRQLRHVPEQVSTPTTRIDVLAKPFNTTNGSSTTIKLWARVSPNPSQDCDRKKKGNGTSNQKSRDANRNIRARLSQLSLELSTPKTKQVWIVWFPAPLASQALSQFSLQDLSNL